MKGSLGEGCVLGARRRVGVRRWGYVCRVRCGRGRDWMGGI